MRYADAPASCDRHVNLAQSRGAGYFARDFHVGAQVRDFRVPGTDFRGLILRGPFAFCAYLGVPDDAAVVGVDTLPLPVHGGITYCGAGDGLRPVGWYWFGWDYGNEVSHAVTAHAQRVPMWEHPQGASNVRRWNISEVEAELVAAAAVLNTFIAAGRADARRLLQAARKTGT